MRCGNHDVAGTSLPLGGLVGHRAGNRLCWRLLGITTHPRIRSHSPAVCAGVRPRRRYGTPNLRLREHHHRGLFLGPIPPQADAGQVARSPNFTELGDTVDAAADLLPLIGCDWRMVVDPTASTRRILLLRRGSSLPIDADFCRRRRRVCRILDRRSVNPGCSQAISNEFLSRLCKTAMWIEPRASQLNVGIEDVVRGVMRRRRRPACTVMCSRRNRAQNQRASKAHADEVPAGDECIARTRCAPSWSPTGDPERALPRSLDAIEQPEPLLDQLSCEAMTFPTKV